jgi:hypothetical protein
MIIKEMMIMLIIMIDYCMQMLSDAEVDTGGAYFLDFLSNGFKLRGQVLI